MNHRPTVEKFSPAGEKLISRYTREECLVRNRMGTLDKDSYIRFLEADNARLKAENLELRRVHEFQSMVIEATRRTGQLIIQPHPDLKRGEMILRPLPEYTADDLQKALEKDRERITAYIKDNFIPMIESEKSLLVIVAKVEAAATMRDRQQARESLAKTEAAAALSAIYINYLGSVRAAGVSAADISEIATSIGKMTSEYIEGIHRFITGQDNGDYLRGQITQYSSKASQIMLDVREGINVGGRTKELHRSYLRDEVKNLKEKEPSMSARDIVRTLIQYYEKLTDHERQPWHTDALKELNTRGKNNPKEYIRWLTKPSKR